MRYKQTTSDGCLASCLFDYDNEHCTKKDELNAVVAGLSERDDFLCGTLKWFVKERKKKYVICVEFYNYITFLKSSLKDHLDRIKIIHDFISVELLSDIKHLRPIVRADSYDFFPSPHYPHFVKILDFIDGYFLIYDPWYGREYRIPASNISYSIDSVRRKLSFSPLVIWTEE